MNNPERKDFNSEINIPADESGHSEKKTDLLIDRKMGSGLRTTSNIVFNIKNSKKKKRK